MPISFHKPTDADKKTTLEYVRQQRRKKAGAMAPDEILLRDPRDKSMPLPPSRILDTPEKIRDMNKSPKAKAKTEQQNVPRVPLTPKFNQSANNKTRIVSEDRGQKRGHEDNNDNGLPSKKQKRIVVGTNAKRQSNRPRPASSPSSMDDEGTETSTKPYHGTVGNGYLGFTTPAKQTNQTAKETNMPKNIRSTDRPRPLADNEVDREQAGSPKRPTKDGGTDDKKKDRYRGTAKATTSNSARQASPAESKTWAPGKVASPLQKRKRVSADTDDAVSKKQKANPPPKNGTKPFVDIVTNTSSRPSKAQDNTTALANITSLSKNRVETQPSVLTQDEYGHNENGHFKMPRAPKGSILNPNGTVTVPPGKDLVYNSHPTTYDPRKYRKTYISKLPIDQCPHCQKAAPGQNSQIRRNVQQRPKKARPTQPFRVPRVDDDTARLMTEHQDEREAAKSRKWDSGEGSAAWSWWRLRRRWTVSYNKSNVFMESSLANLNAAQYSAVTSPCSVLQILAPPGSGKTKTLTSRVAYLLSHHDYRPWDLLCLTFTIKSAREMRERIAKLIGNGMERRLVLGTFHSVCRRYLVSYGHLIGIRKGFGIADRPDSTSIIRRLVKRMNLKIDPKKAQSRISSCKSRGITYTEVAQEGTKKKDLDQQEFCLVYEAYESLLGKSNLLDYDDLLLRCVDLLQQHPACVSNVEVVLIDEFQDTNLVQFDLMRLFAVKNKRITTVGDPDQSIYGWRSAEVGNLKKMQKHYPDTLVIHLKDNYRSSGSIIFSASEVIEQDEARIPRPLQPTHCLGTAPVLRRIPTAEAEASWIVSEIERCMALTGGLLKCSDFAILLRSAALSLNIESAMGRFGIPYRMVGGNRFFDRVEIKILLDYLRVVSQPRNNDALARIINVPARHIGPTTVKSLLETAETTKSTLWLLIRKVAQGHAIPSLKVPKQAQQGLGSLIRIILSATQQLSDGSELLSPELLLRHLIKRLDFEEYLKKAHEQDYDARWANVEELLAQASDYQAATANPALADAEWDILPDILEVEQLKATPAEEALSRFLANVALATEIQREEESNDQAVVPQHRVTISTMHAAKGLEWPVVFVPAAYEGSIPHSRAEDTDEERRLLYVAMTRAQALLYISCPTKNSHREDTSLSPFVSSKKVGHYFTNKGPKFKPSEVQDMARILRREGPTERALIEGRETATSLEDDRWPLNGDENPKDKELWWNKWTTTDSTNDCIDRPLKRRRVIDDPSQTVPTISASPMDMSMPLSFLVGTATTMQDPSAFSYVSGFTTAATQLHAIEAEQAVCSPKKRKTTSESLPASSKAMSSQQKRSGEQSALSSFFTTDRKGPGRRDPPAKRAAIDAHKRSSDLGLLESGFDPTKISSADRVPIVTTADPPARPPLFSIPQILSEHRLPRQPPTKFRPSLHKDNRTKDYVFLSSSPPQPSEISGTKSIDKPEAKMLNRTIHNSATKPASAFHTTSVAQAQSINGGMKRTLGVKRSMNGWAARGGKGFAVPRGVGGGG